VGRISTWGPALNLVADGQDLLRTMTAAQIDQVIERVLAGEQQAYGRIVRRYQQELWRVAAFALRDRAQTEDLVQQAFVTAYTKLDSFERGRDFGAWLRGITRNLARQELRRRARDDRRLMSYLAHLEALGDDDSADEHEAALRSALADCEQHLPQPARKALRLRYSEALDFAAVADAIGRTVAGARQLLQRVRLQLRDCIQEKLA